MADTKATHEALHVLLLKHVAHQTIAFAQVKVLTITCGHAGSILSAVLQHGQRIVYLLINGVVADDPDDATHARVLGDSRVTSRIRH